jgi:uncharacterized protein YciI
MALFVIVAVDRPGRLDRRRATREAHLAHLAKFGDSIRAAGPFTDEVGTPCGSMLVVEAGSLADAESMAADDPYALAGVFESVAVRPWYHVLGTGLEPAN